MSRFDATSWDTRPMSLICGDLAGESLSNIESALAFLERKVKGFDRHAVTFTIAVPAYRRATYYTSQPVALPGLGGVNPLLNFPYPAGVGQVARLQRIRISLVNVAQTAAAARTLSIYFTNTNTVSTNNLALNALENLDPPAVLFVETAWTTPPAVAAALWQVRANIPAASTGQTTLLVDDTFSADCKPITLRSKAGNKTGVVVVDDSGGAGGAGSYVIETWWTEGE